LRWPGWAAIWRPLKDLGFLDETPVPGLGDGTYDKNIAYWMEGTDWKKDH
jgi:saccharopine dehydrogenase-like NADP-dependent oxidoreductase